jgi:hypothetical protein
MDYKILQNVLFNAVNNIDSTTELRAEVDSISISAWSGSYTDETTTNLFSKGNYYHYLAVNILLIVLSLINRISIDSKISIFIADIEKNSIIVADRYNLYLFFFF